MVKCQIANGFGADAVVSTILVVNFAYCFERLGENAVLVFRSFWIENSTVPEARIRQ